jgi:hypothetical protein
LLSELLVRHPDVNMNMNKMQVIADCKILLFKLL